EVDLISGPSHGAEGSLESKFASAPGCLTVMPDLIRAVRPATDFRAYRQLAARFRAHRPTIVHTHSGKAGILGRLAARRAGVPWVIHTIHGPSFGPFQGPLARFLLKAAERLAGRCTDHFVVVADAMTQQYLAAGIGRPEQYTRIFSGFELAPFLNARRDPSFAHQMGLRDGDFVIGKVARLFKLKGHEDLFAIAPDLVRQIPRVRFLLVGDGPYRDQFERLANETGVRDRFVFAGLVPPEQMPRYYALMDVLVHLSRREGLPRALPQALAAGKPVVAFDCDGAREVCLDGQTGFLVPLGQKELLVERLRRLEGDSGLREQMAATGREFVRNRFGVEVMVEELRALYRRLVGSREQRQLPDRIDVLRS
ncbi:MAG TPA: glycosyltransferase family 4 protein, partial [Verrucomicrobiota bacterium]|nr:glycosyltransferase family 4 protein [Verrucomicrobiota bacterium]